MAPLWLTILGGTIVALIAGMFWRRARAAQLRSKQDLAMLDLRDQSPELAKSFLAAAASSGKPRGLRWKSCEFNDSRTFATDISTGELVALIGATISFEAVEGGDMEDVEAVGNLRSGTVVFVHRTGQWLTDGRALFNLEPQQALERFAGSLAPIDR